MAKEVWCEGMSKVLKDALCVHLFPRERRFATYIIITQLEGMVEWRAAGGSSRQTIRRGSLVRCRKSQSFPKPIELCKYVACFSFLKRNSNVQKNTRKRLQITCKMYHEKNLFVSNFPMKDNEKNLLINPRIGYLCSFQAMFTAP